MSATLRRQAAKDARHASRYEMRLAIAFERSGGRVEATSRNIGLGGMFIETMEPASFGEPLTIYLPLPGFPSAVAIPSVVRWTSGDGMGVQFGLMGARVTYALTKLIFDG
jgi:type IV pilus assembly protein PilZ